MSNYPKTLHKNLKRIIFRNSNRFFKKYFKHLSNFFKLYYNLFRNHIFLSINLNSCIKF